MCACVCVYVRVCVPAALKCAMHWLIYLAIYLSIYLCIYVSSGFQINFQAALLLLLLQRLIKLPLRPALPCLFSVSPSLSLYISNYLTPVYCFVWKVVGQLPFTFAASNFGLKSSPESFCDCYCTSPLSALLPSHRDCDRCTN